MCHALLQDPAFFRFLKRIDEEFATETRADRCQRCGGALHSAPYPRKPRGIPAAVVDEYSKRLSFTCGRCDKRATPKSVRFLGRRVYAAVVLMLVSAPGGSPGHALCGLLTVPQRTVSRWRTWWGRDFACTAFWQSMRGYFPVPVLIAGLPHSLPDDRRTELLLLLVSGIDESDGRFARLLKRAGYAEQRQVFCVVLVQSVDPLEIESPARATPRCE